MEGEGHERWVCVAQLQLGVQGILVLDARESGPAGSAGVHGTKRDQNGRLVLGDIITGFNNMRVRCPHYSSASFQPWQCTGFDAMIHSQSHTESG